jgi:hypothetical protein
LITAYIIVVLQAPLPLPWLEAREARPIAQKTWAANPLSGATQTEAGNIRAKALVSMRFPGPIAAPIPG